MSKSCLTRNFSIRIDEILYQKGQILKNKHPNISHSQIYAEGLRALIEKAVEQGLEFPDNIIEELLTFEQAKIEQCERNIAELVELKKKQAVVNARSPTRSSQASGVKPGFIACQERDPETGKMVTVAVALDEVA